MRTGDSAQAAAVHALLVQENPSVHAGPAPHPGGPGREEDPGDSEVPVLVEPVVLPAVDDALLPAFAAPEDDAGEDGPEEVVVPPPGMAWVQAIPSIPVSTVASIRVFMTAPSPPRARAPGWSTRYAMDVAGARARGMEAVMRGVLGGLVLVLGCSGAASSADGGDGSGSSSGGRASSSVSGMASSAGASGGESGCDGYRVGDTWCTGSLLLTCVQDGRAVENSDCAESELRCEAAPSVNGYLQAGCR